MITPDIEVLRRFTTGPKGGGAVCFDGDYIRQLVAYIDHLGQGAGSVRVIEFADQDALEEYVETELNEKGIEPTVAFIDSNGTQTIAFRTAPGGDGYGFEFDMSRSADTGQRHCCECSHEGGPCPEFNLDWTPKFPVWVMERKP